MSVFPKCTVLNTVHVGRTSKVHVVSLGHVTFSFYFIKVKMVPHINFSSLVSLIIHDVTSDHLMGSTEPVVDIIVAKV